MNPSLTVITLYPALFMGLIILSLSQISFLDLSGTKIYCVTKLTVTLIAPSILLICSEVEVVVAPNTRTLTVQTIAKEDGRFK
jgi:hypothetical protein